MIRQLVFVGGIAALLWGCVTDAPDRGQDPANDAFTYSSKNYFLLMECVDDVASLPISKGYPAKESIEVAAGYCAPQMNTYLAEVENKVKRRNGWSSLDQSVRPALRKKVVEKLIAEMSPVYRSAQQGS